MYSMSCDICLMFCSELYWLFCIAIYLSFILVTSSWILLVISFRSLKLLAKSFLPSLDSKVQLSNRATSWWGRRVYSRGGGGACCGEWGDEWCGMSSKKKHWQGSKHQGCGVRGGGGVLVAISVIRPPKHMSPEVDSWVLENLSRINFGPFSMYSPWMTPQWAMQ